ncbi:MAG TPA: cadmium-translocating P-type ATPase [Ruminococcaceae bacterium]|nr:cadmium-translocating P-type ATPase [Oscillospiraceae bacterium]
MTRKQKKHLARIIVAAVLLGVLWVAPLEGIWQLLAYCVPYFIVGWDVLWGAIRKIMHGDLMDEEFLMSVATIGAFVLKDYKEAVAVMLFYQIGEWFQGVAVGKTRRNITQLMDLRPDYANVVRNGQEEKVDPEEVEVGETIIVRPGEKIPLDGLILEGSTSVNTAALTGESLPQDKAAGDSVVSGTVNLTGVITVQTQSAYGESTAAKILELVENAADQKAKVEGFITRFAHWYTPCVVVGAALLAFIPPLFFSQPWAVWVQRALVFLVVSCPCALVVSVPLTFFGGIGGASRCGILVKGAGYMETIAKAKTVVFDKTGTLTKGSFTVTHIVPAQGTEEDLLALAAAAESFSHHPIAQSVVAAYGKPIEKDIEDAKDHTGRGIEAVIDGRHIYAGNERLMKETGVACSTVNEIGTIIHLAADQDYLGYLVIADTPKADSAEAIRALKAEGVQKTVMLTGDKKAVAEAVAGELGLDEYRAELLPADKVTAVEELLKTGSPLVFVGDGINDAPVLARADVGVAMGALGSDAAIEAADIVLMDDAPSKLALAVKLSRRTMRIVWQNVIFALAVKAIVLVLGAMGDANMWIAVFADVGVLVLAILNAMRALIVPKN